MSINGGPGREAVRALLAATPEARATLLASLPEPLLRRLQSDWPAWLHAGQQAPPGDWRTWLMLAGRGFGKTRAGAEWVLACLRDPEGLLGTAGPVSVALVAATPGEARRVMIEGEAGLLAAARARDDAEWRPSLGRLDFASGAQAFVFSGAHPDGLRGAQHHIAWCDELAKWDKPVESWTNLQLGLRKGRHPRALVTTTPRAIAALTGLIGTTGTVITRGRTIANPHTSALWKAAMLAEHDGTRLGRQELDGELIEDVDGSLWPRALIERCRRPLDFARDERGLARVVVGVDPPAGMDGAECGIVVAGIAAGGALYVLADASRAGLSPEGWARATAEAAAAWGADRIVAEANQGGEMVRSVLKNAGVSVGVQLVHATRGKTLRAEPIATLFESGRAWFAGRFPELEDQLTGLTTGGGYRGPSTGPGGGSPDRADACVWALTALDKPIIEPRIRTL